MKVKLIAIIMITTIITAQAQTDNTKTKWSVEIDPSTFMFKGYSAHLRYSLTEHILLGAGAYAMDFPDVFVNMNAQNKNEGWKVRLSQGYGLFSEYYFQEVNQKWFLGAQVAYQEYQISKETNSTKSTYETILTMGYFGYSWQPFDFNMYVKPWAGIGYSNQVNANTTLGDDTYDVSPITMFATLHIGYTF
ncbi:MAG: hypothetical protein OCD76_02290 [Reichenbachiella sp.]